MVRAAIVGIGWWGRTLVGAARGSAALRFTAAHNRTRANAEAFCAEHGLALKDSLDDILRDPEIDAVVFTTPHSEHGGQVERAAAAGKHVLMEKPFTLDVKSATAALDAAARAGIVLGVGFHRRFHPATRELKARVQDGRLGTIVHCHGEQNTPAGLFMDKNSWRASASEAPAGGMTASGVHNMDAMIGLFGRVAEVYCRCTRRAIDYDAQDTTSVMLDFENGMTATLLCTLATAANYRLAVFGTKGCAELQTQALDFRFTPATNRPATGRYKPAVPELIEYKGFNGLAAQLDGFAAAVEGRAALPIAPEEILHGVAVFEAIVNSAAMRQPVKVART